MGWLVLQEFIITQQFFFTWNFKIVVSRQDLKQGRIKRPVSISSLFTEKQKVGLLKITSSCFFNISSTNSSKTIEFSRHKTIVKQKKPNKSRLEAFVKQEKRDLSKKPAFDFFWNWTKLTKCIEKRHFYHYHKFIYKFITKLFFWSLWRSLYCYGIMSANSQMGFFLENSRCLLASIC